MTLITDGILLAFALMMVVSGARRGVIFSALAAAGAAGGLWAGLTLVPVVVSWLGAATAASPIRVVVSIAVVLALASIGMTLGSAIARRTRRVVGSIPGGKGVDAVGGSVFGAIAWALTVWLIAGLAVSSGTLPFSQLANTSTVVQALNKVVPLNTKQVFGAVDDAFAGMGLPKVFSGGEGTPAAVEAPPSSTPAAVSVRAESVVRVTAMKQGCGVVASGSGWPIAADELVTNAHVVAGATAVSISIPGRPGSRVARVVYFDPDVDVALLRVSNLGMSPLTVQRTASASGDAGFAIGYPGGGPLTVTPSRVRSVVQAVGLDIYNRSPVSRQIYSLRAQVRPGDSGGPLVNDAGRVVGLVFARSATDAETGYALTSAQMERSLASAGDSTTAVSTGACPVE